MLTSRLKVIQTQQLMLEKLERCSVLPPSSWCTDALLRFIRSSRSQRSPQHKLRAQQLPEQGLGKHISSHATAEPPFPLPSSFPKPTPAFYSHLPITQGRRGHAGQGDRGDSAPGPSRLGAAGCPSPAGLDRSLAASPERGRDVGGHKSPGLAFLSGELARRARVLPRHSPEEPDRALLREHW